MASPSRTTFWSSAMSTRIMRRTLGSIGMVSRTRQPSPRGPASSSPPARAARSPRPARPKPPDGSAATAGEPPLSTTSAATDDSVHVTVTLLRLRGGCVLRDVGQCLLDAAVDRETRLAGEGKRLSDDLVRDQKPYPAGIVDQRRDVGGTQASVAAQGGDARLAPLRPSRASCPAWLTCSMRRVS